MRRIHLTPREKQILELAAKGHRDARIAELVGMTPNAVKLAVRRALRGNGCRNRTELVARAIRYGALEQGRYASRVRRRFDELPEKGIALVAANPWPIAERARAFGLAIVESDVVPEGVVLIVDVEKILELTEQGVRLNLTDEEIATRIVAIARGVEGS